jgi:hypothetical protein
MHQSKIRDVLNEAYAEHSPSSDLNLSVFDFLDQHGGK